MLLTFSGLRWTQPHLNTAFIKTVRRQAIPHYLNIRLLNFLSSANNPKAAITHSLKSSGFVRWLCENHKCKQEQ